MYLDKTAILESLSDSDIIKICIELGSEYPKDDGQGNYIFQTGICHGGDSWKLYYYTDNHMFHCFTCGESFGIIDLVIRANKLQGKKISWYNALLYIATLTNKVISKDTPKVDSSTIIDDWGWLNNVSKATSKKHKEIPVLKEYNEHVLELFKYAPIEDWLFEGISEDVMSQFEIGYYPLQNCITIPVRDEEARFIGLRARYMLEDDIAKGKYRPMVVSGEVKKFNTGLTLYGLPYNKHAIAQTKKCFLFEAEKSVMLNHTFYGDNDLSLCVFGSNITDTQVKILQKLGVTHLIICFDKEYHKSDSYEAEIYYNKLLKKVAPLMNFFTIELVLDRKDLLDYKDSPVDKGYDVWTELIDDKILVTTEDIEKMKDEEKGDTNGED